MPRKTRTGSATGVYHFINRAINKQILFRKPRDYDFYLMLVQEYQKSFNVRIYHYCLMSNHTHMLLWLENIKLLGQFAHFVHRRYVYYYNKNYAHNGPLFRNRFTSIPIETDLYLMECGRYIERNPLRANLVQDLKDYPYSSYPYYAFNKRDALITSNPLYVNSNAGNDMSEKYQDYVLSKRLYEKMIDGVLVHN